MLFLWISILYKTHNNVQFEERLMCIRTGELSSADPGFEKRGKQSEKGGTL
jgi:hypothetical protein